MLSLPTSSGRIPLVRATAMCGGAVPASVLSDWLLRRGEAEAANALGSLHLAPTSRVVWTASGTTLEVRHAKR